MIHDVRAPGMEILTAWGIEGGRRLSGNYQFVPLFVGMGWQRRGKQGLGVRVQRIVTQFQAFSSFDNLTQVNDRDAVAFMNRRSQVVPYKDVAYAQFLLQFLQQGEDVGADRPSRAETGSSSTINSALVARARAMAIRWRWPPLNSWGERRATSGCKPTSSITSPTRLLTPWRDIIL